MARAGRPTGGLVGWQRHVALAAGVVAVAWLLVVFRDVFVLMALALVVAASMAPLAAAIERHGVPHGVAVSAVMAGLLAAIAGAIAFVVPQIAAQAGQLGQNLPGLADRLVALEARWFGDGLGLTTDGLMAWLRERGEAIGRHATAGALVIAKTTVGLLATLFVGYYFLLDRHRLADQAAALLPPAARREARAIGHEAFVEVGRAMLGRLAIMAAVGVATGLGLWAVGVPYPLVLGLVAGLLDLVPFVGPLVAGGVGVLVALGHEPGSALAAAAVYLVVQGAENYFLAPVIFGRATGLHPVWVFLALVAGDQALGILGVLLAIPAAVVVHVAVKRVYRPALTIGPSDPRQAISFALAEPRLPALRRRPERLRVSIAPEAPEPASSSAPGASGPGSAGT